MNFNINTYYSVQNFGTDYYLGRNDANLASSPTAWQIGRCPGSNALFIRYGTSCLVPYGAGPIGLVACTASHVTWLLNYANGKDSSDGYYLTNTEVNNTLSLSNNPGPPPDILMAYNPGITQAIPYFAWAFQTIAQNSWPDSGPRAVDFCSGSSLSSISSSRTTTSTSSTNSPSSPASQTGSNSFSNPSMFSNVIVSSTPTTISATQTPSITPITSASASSSQQATVTVTQQASASPARSQASSEYSRPRKLLMLAMLAIPTCLQLVAGGF